MARGIELERRLTTIVAADIAGFTRLVDADEERTLSAQRAHRDQFLDPLIAKFGGRIANTAGDSLLIEFPSAVQAVRFAVEAQDGMRERNCDTPEDQRICYRIGINVGDVVPDGEDLLGDGVNVAARLEALASPGGVLLSRTVRDQIRDKLDIPLEDLGEVRVKNLTRPVRAFRVADDSAPVQAPNSRKPVTVALVVALVSFIAASSLWWWFERPDVEPVRPEEMAYALREEPSIAVMAFSYIGPGQAENEYLAAGLSENITTNLAKLPDILVIGQGTGLKEENASGRDIAGRFGVRYILDGSVQKSGEELRISAKLLDAISGKHLWSETFNRSAGDFFDIQDEITLSVLEQVFGGTVDGDRLTLRETDSLKAFSENVKGRTHRVRFTAEDNIIAREHYDAALALDPDYVDALVGTAFTHIMDVRLAFSENPSQSLAQAEEYLSIALDLIPDRPATLSNLAVLRIVQKRGDEAIEFARRALETGIGDVRVVRSAAWVLKYAGASKESLPYFARAKRMTPVSLWWLLVDEYGAFIDAGEFEAAKMATGAYLAVLPEIYRAEFLTWPAVVAWNTERPEDAEAFIAEARKLKPDLSIASLQPFDRAYVDPSIPERRYDTLRRMGLSD